MDICKFMRHLTFQCFSIENTSFCFVLIILLNFFRFVLALYYSILIGTNVLNSSRKDLLRMLDNLLQMV